MQHFGLPYYYSAECVVCDLHEVKVTRNIDPSFSNPDAEVQSKVTLEDLGINLPNDTLTKDQQEKTKDLVENGNLYFEQDLRI